MSTAATANSYRRRLALQAAGGAIAKPPALFAFGDGGHNADGSAKPVTGDEAQLGHELLRKAIVSRRQEDGYSATYVGVIEKTELVGKGISEVAILDEDGEMCGIKRFGVKYKESDENYEIQIRLKF